MADDSGFELTEEEKEEVRRKIDNVTGDDEAMVRSAFAAKYGAVGETLLNSRFKAVRDLALNVACLWEMIADPDYAVDLKVKAGVVFALSYFISPVDAIPDAVPVVGHLDDAMVVAYVVHLLSEDIVKYRKFRHEAGRPLPTT